MSDTARANRKTSPPEPPAKVGAGAPEPTLCRVGALIRGFEAGWCLVRPIPYCQFGFTYGDGYLCRHPEIERIIARTQAQQSIPRGLSKPPQRAD